MARLLRYIHRHVSRYALLDVPCWWTQIQRNLVELFLIVTLISEKIRAWNDKPNNKRRPKPEFVSILRDWPFARRGPVAPMNIKVVYSEPCLPFENHLQKHTYGLYFHFNLRKLRTVLNPFGSFLASILGVRMPVVWGPRQKIFYLLLVLWPV